MKKPEEGKKLEDYPKPEEEAKLNYIPPKKIKFSAFSENEKEY